MIRRLTSSPKPWPRVAAMTRSAVGLSSGIDAQAEAHAVELGQVAGRLGRQDQVVRRERVREVRAGDLDDLGARAAQQLERLLEPREHAGLVALALQLA